MVGFLYNIFKVQLRGFISRLDVEVREHCIRVHDNIFGLVTGSMELPSAKIEKVVGRPHFIGQ